MSALTIGSLFSGIGGLELGLERGIGNGAHTVWQVEQNEYCRAVLAKHWPDATRYEDVRHVGRANLAPVDLICGGFPCQDISIGNKSRKGLAGKRSGLWGEYCRIIRELRPRYVVVENVAALLAPVDGAIVAPLGTVLGDLAESGYDAEWECLPAGAVGAPHVRDRVLLVAYPNGERLPRRAVFGSGRSERARLQQQLPRLLPAGTWADHPVPTVYRVGDGVRRPVDEVRALGNAVVPQVAEVVGRLIAEREAALQEAA